MLALITLLPLLTAAAIAFCVPQARHRLVRLVATVGASLTFAISAMYLLPLIAGPAPGGAEFHSLIDVRWLPDAGVSFILGADGLSASLVLLTNLLVLVSIAASWTAVDRRQKEFYVFLLILHTGIIGTFLALDLIVFYIFWELMLVPLYFLIGIFGSGNRIYATMKFFLYTMAGSMLMLVGILALHFLAEPLLGYATFSVLDLTRVSGQLAPRAQQLIFLSFLIAFAIKVPLFPFHTWLPDAHTEAPTAGSILLAGVLLKTGVYGMMRFAIPLFPAVALEFAPTVMLLSLIAIIWGALAAFAQSDMKRLVAYSSVSHMGFIMLGLFAFNREATAGAALQMINHGVSTGALFFCVGVLYERRHTRELSEFGGLAWNMKVYAVLTVIVVLSSVGLPGLNGFIGEFLILFGTFRTHPWHAAVAASGVILAAVYLLRMVQLTLFGPLDKEANRAMPDVNRREALTLVVLVALAFWLGLYPRPVVERLQPAADRLTALVGAAQPAGELALAGH